MRPKLWWLWRQPGPFVALTFDDGPHPEHTPAVLDRLEAFGTTATFYLVGRRVAGAPYLPRRIAAAGHTLGNHTFTHTAAGWRQWAGAWRDVGECQRIITATGEVRPRVFRPPLGRLRPPQLLAAAGHGLAVRLWTLDSNDWRCRSDDEADRCVAAVLSQVRPGDVLLFHDDHRYVGRILDAVLPGLLARGLLGQRPRPITHELGEGGHGHTTDAPPPPRGKWSIACSSPTARRLRRRADS